MSRCVLPRRHIDRRWHQSRSTNGGTFALDGPGNFVLNGSVTVGADGNNVLDVSQGIVSGGTIVQNGGMVNAGTVIATDFQVNGGALQIGGLTGFDGTIGGPSGPAIGQFGEVNVFNAENVAQASLDTTTGLLTFQDSTGNALGSLQFASTDDLSGLELSRPAGGPLVITDQPGASVSGSDPDHLHHIKVKKTCEALHNDDHLRAGILPIRTKGGPS